MVRMFEINAAVKYLEVDNTSRPVCLNLTRILLSSRISLEAYSESLTCVIFELLVFSLQDVIKSKRYCSYHSEKFHGVYEVDVVQELLAYLPNEWSYFSIGSSRSGGIP